jgi:hypothetical protein
VASVGGARVGRFAWSLFPMRERRWELLVALSAKAVLVPELRRQSV